MTWTTAMETELRVLLTRAWRKEARKKTAMEASCNGKPGFSTAQHAHDSMPKRNHGGKIMVYRCKHCNKWHIGSHLAPASRDRRPKAVDTYQCRCGHRFDEKLGAYGCPNCCGEYGVARRVG